MPRRPVLLASLLAFASLAQALLGPASAIAASRYRVVDLGFVPSATSAIPARFGPPGTLVGWCNLPGTFGGHAASWSLSSTGQPLAVVDLDGLPSNDWSAAYGINSAGWVVGYSNTDKPQPRPVLWRHGNVVDIDSGSDGNANVYAFDINDSNVICGMITKSGGGGGWDAAVWIEDASRPGRFDRTFLRMHPSGDPIFGWTEAQSMLEDGRIFGRTNLGGGDRATLWSADTAHAPALLEPLAGTFSDQTMPGDINDLGDAVGYTMLPFGMYRATRWSRDAAHTPSELPAWPGHNSAMATVVSPAGDIVLGISNLIDASVFPWISLEQRMLMWQDGVTFDLGQQLDDSGAGWTLESINDMDDRGWIAASAFRSGVLHAVLLIPVAEVTAAPPSGMLAVQLAPAPNPSQDEVRLSFTLPRAGGARLRITDAQGRNVRTLVTGERPAGPQHVQWDGRDASGARVAAGLYFGVLESAAGRSSTRIARVR